MVVALGLCFVIDEFCSSSFEVRKKAHAAFAGEAVADG